MKGADRERGARTRPNKARLAEMIETAIVDAYGEAEQATGWLTVLEEHLALPFGTEVLGVAVTVTRLDIREGNQIVAICTRGRSRQAIGLADLPLPASPPPGAEWIEAYRLWLEGRY
jgi:hypothetical protein